MSVSSNQAAAVPSSGIHSEPPGLLVEGIAKNFGGVHALKGVDFQAAQGEVMALVGDNGAGKSTLMKIIAGAETPDAGRILLNGAEVTINSPHDASDLGIQTVFQDLAICENLDVAANLFLGHEAVADGWAKWLPFALRPLRSFDMEEQAQEAVARLKVSTLKSIRANVGQLSGGQRQAIAIARATRAQSSVVLLDEPTAALGIAQTRQVLDVVGQLKRNDHAVVFISHNLRDVFEVADRITVLYHGTHVGVWRTADTTPDEIVVAITSGAGPGSVSRTKEQGDVG
jgi:D-xylose transport system ATP-binding protein